MTLEHSITTDFLVHYYEADQQGDARPVALLNYLQSAAGDHARSLGVSVADLLKSGHTWVLSRVHLQLDRVPRVRETVSICTWPVSRETVFTVRDFELRDASGAQIGRATTSWAVLNVASRRPARLSDVLPDYPLHPHRALEDSFASLPVLEVSRDELRLPVLRGDVDMNRHVNNTVYAGWALETVPQEVAETCRLSSIEIGFRAEALYGDTIVARSAPAGDDPDCFLHRIDNAADGRELARLRTRWTTREQP